MARTPTPPPMPDTYCKHHTELSWNNVRVMVTLQLPPGVH